MTLLGFMLMTMSINVLANNTNEEEKNTTTVVVENSVNRSVAEEHNEYMTISLQDEEPVYIPFEFNFEGYRFDINQTDIAGQDPGCIEWVNDGARIFRIRIIPRWLGQAILKLFFMPILENEDDPAPPPIVVNIHITVNNNN